MSWNPTAKTLRSVLLSLLLLTGVPTQSKTKDEAQTKVGNVTITWDDLNWKINALFGSFFVFVAFELWTSYKKSKDTTAQDIKASAQDIAEIKKMMTSFQTELEHRPTWKELRNHDFQG